MRLQNDEVFIWSHVLRNAHQVWLGTLLFWGGNIISYFSCVPGLKFSEGIDPSLGLSSHKLLEEK